MVPSRLSATAALATLAILLPGSAAAQGYSTSQDLMFEALDRNMWGGGGGGSITYGTFLGLQWNESLSIGDIVGSEDQVIIPGGCVIWCWNPVTGDTRTGLQFTGRTSGKIGLQVEAMVNSGSLDVTMPVTASLTTSDFSTINPGGRFSVGTDYLAGPDPASLHTLFPSVKLFADFVFEVEATGTGTACFTFAGCSTEIGTFFDVSETVELASLNRDGDNVARILGAEVNLGQEFDMGPIEGKLSLPNLETTDQGSTTSLSSTGEVNVLELGVDVPKVVADFILPGSGALLSGSLLGVGYNVLSSSLGPRFGIGQSFLFTSTPMVTLAFDTPVALDKETIVWRWECLQYWQQTCVLPWPVADTIPAAPAYEYTVPLGTQLDFLFPERLSLGLTPKYWLQNEMQVETDLLTSLGGGVEILSITTPIGGLGPLYAADFQTSPLTFALDSRSFALDFNEVQGSAFQILAQGNTVVPEPSTWLMLATGLGLLGLVQRGRRRRKGEVA
jgi:hypothetical protein